MVPFHFSSILSCFYFCYYKDAVKEKRFHIFSKMVSRYLKTILPDFTIQVHLTGFFGYTGKPLRGHRAHHRSAWPSRRPTIFPFSNSRSILVKTIFLPKPI